MFLKSNYKITNHDHPAYFTVSISSEAKLVQLLHSNLTGAVRKNSIIVNEFDCANGIADLVIADISKNWKSLALSGNINPRWLFALRQLPYRRSFSLSTFSLLSGVSTRRAREALLEFSNAGFCKRITKADTWIKIYQPRRIATKICAIEAKLKDWKRALIQANRYLDFADESWVVLDKARVTTATDNIDSFKQLGIGLASMSNDGWLQVYFRAPISGPRSEMRIWQANSKIAAALKSINGWPRKR